MATGEAAGPYQEEAPGPVSSRDLAVAAVAVLLAAAVLYLDAISPLGYGVGFFFIVPFLVVVFGLPRVPPFAAAAAVEILLSASGFLLSPPEIPVAVALVGRAAFSVLIAGIAVFIDRYRRVSRERRALDARYRALFWRHYTTVLVIDPANSRSSTPEDPWPRFSSYSRNVLRTMRIFDLNAAPEETVQAGMREAADGQQAPFRFVHRPASGEERHVESLSGPVVVGGQSLLYSIIHDVTEARQVEEALRASEARHHSLVDELQEGMVLYQAVPDTEGSPADFRVINLNPANERMFGRTRDGTIGRTLRDLYGDPLPLVRIVRPGRRDWRTRVDPVPRSRRRPAVRGPALPARPRPGGRPLHRHDRPVPC